MKTILTLEEAEPIINNLINEASHKIYNQTGVHVCNDDILTDLSDCEWVFSVCIIEDTEYIDIIEAEKQLNNITERYIKIIFDELKEEE